MKDFRIADGVMVDLGGDIDAIMDIKMKAIETPAVTYGLSQNIPNPFNPATLIEYQLAEPGNVHIVIYNLLGQEIRTLVREEMAQGHYSVLWDGTNEMGNQVASGVYMYRMSAGDFTQTQRMMLLK